MGANKGEILKVKIAYVKLEEQIPLLGGNLIICAKGQVMDFRALSKIHPLKWNCKQMLVKLSFSLIDQTVLSFNYFLFFCAYSSREDVMGTAVQKVTFADTLICELHPLSRLISCNNQNQGSVTKNQHTSSRVEVSAALKNSKCIQFLVQNSMSCIFIYKSWFIWPCIVLCVLRTCISAGLSLVQMFRSQTFKKKKVCKLRLLCGSWCLPHPRHNKKTTSFNWISQHLRVFLTQ